MPNPIIQYKNPLEILAWLGAALSKEREKYRQCPVLPDIVPGFVDATGWGYVVADYFLVEESFKALLYIGGGEVHRGHSLSSLFALLEENKKDILREYYADYRKVIGGNRGEFPFLSLDEFIVNLDGDPNQRGEHFGSFDWRYMLIEQNRSQEMPTVSIDYLHEIVVGCTQILRTMIVDRYDPLEFTLSWRMREEREKKYNDWIESRLLSGELGELGDRVEILWGPDYKGRHDLIIFEGQGQTPCFAERPTDQALPVIDKRAEIEALNTEI